MDSSANHKLSGWADISITGKTAETLAEDQDEVTLVPLFAGTEVTANNATYTAEFPSADEMAGYDTMIADLRVAWTGPPGLGGMGLRGLHPVMR